MFCPYTPRLEGEEGDGKRHIDIAGVGGGVERQAGGVRAAAGGRIGAGLICVLHVDHERLAGARVVRRLLHRLNCCTQTAASKHNPD